MRACTLLQLGCLLLASVLASAEEAPRPAEPGAPAALLQQLSASPGSCAPKLPSAAGGPEPSFADHGDGCHAEVFCFARCTLTCEGTNVCEVGSGSITCDGYTQYCPPSCSAPIGCVDVCGKCQCQAEGGSSTYCAYVHC
jgi:hypothetical protein